MFYIIKYDKIGKDCEENRMKKIVNLLLCLIIILGISGCGKKYTANIQRVREEFNPWQLEVKENVGELLDKALDNSKWTDKDNVVTVKGKDKNTGDDVKITFLIKDDNITFGKMIIGDEEKDYIGFFEYTSEYAD